MTSGAIPGCLHGHPAGCTLAVRVQPGAKRTVIVGIYGEGDRCQLKIALQAPPVEGRANEALIAYFAGLLALPRSSVTIAHGLTSRSKLVLLGGISALEAQVKLQSALPGSSLR